MDDAIDIRALDEWMYAIHTAVDQLDPKQSEEALALLCRTLDEMREHRAKLRMQRHNELGY